MEEETGLMNVKAETMTVAAHLREKAQLRLNAPGGYAHKHQTLWLRKMTSQ